MYTLGHVYTLLYIRALDMCLYKHIRRPILAYIHPILAYTLYITSPILTYTHPILAYTLLHVCIRLNIHTVLALHMPGLASVPGLPRYVRVTGKAWDRGYARPIYTNTNTASLTGGVASSEPGWSPRRSPYDAATVSGCPPADCEDDDPRG